MDLRKVVDSIMARWGHNILLQRRVVPHGHGPWDIRSNSGFASQVEQWRVRERLPGASAGLVGVVEERMEGKVASVDLVFYFRWNANPKKGDRIYDRTPVGLYTYTIDWAFPFRMAGGRVEYWAVGCSVENEAGDT